MKKISVVCVLKNGGVYTPAHVKLLEQGVTENLSIPFQFVCLTDTGIENGKPLLNNYPKWWSKIEAFRITGAVIYFDLDTAILASINSLAESMIQAKEKGLECLYMLKTYRKTEGFSSGIMAWSGNWRWLSDEFVAGQDMAKYQYDQRYIIAKIEEKKKGIIAVQSLIKGGVWCSKHQIVDRKELEKRKVTISCFSNRDIK